MLVLYACGGGGDEVDVEFRVAAFVPCCQEGAYIFFEAGVQLDIALSVAENEDVLIWVLVIQIYPLREISKVPKDD